MVSRMGLTGALLALLPGAMPGAAFAQGSATARAAPDGAAAAADGDQTDTILVFGRALGQIGAAAAASQGTVGYADFDVVPISRPGELLENVPGLIATQHSGSGKANQYFLRGFNLDHGTDFAGFVDGVPINQRTHGHGQGYLDINFIIPETVARIDYRKGPYFADVGDFSAAGTVLLTTRDTMDPFAQGEIGAFGHRRVLAGGSTALGGGDLLVAGAAQSYDGPWVLEEDLQRFTGLVKFSAPLGSGRLALQANGYDSRWTSTDQIPERSVASGQIDRFGFVDPFLGGSSTRIGATAAYTAGRTAVNAYATHTDFRLLSNFTYVLDDPVGGDEFIQRDRRTTYGGAARHGLPLGPALLTVGADVRHDDIPLVGLYDAQRGRIAGTIRQDAVRETGLGAYADLAVPLGGGVRLGAALRVDRLSWNVDADLPANSGSGSAAQVSPKARLAWRAAEPLEFYADYGRSFHTNDVRGITIAVDPASGDRADPVPAFAPGDGYELGARFQRSDLTATLAVFRLDLASELVFVGDAGSTEPNDATNRLGVEATAFWRPRPWIAVNAEYAHTRARFQDVPADARFIPGTVPEVLTAGVDLRPTPRLALAARLRHFGSAPLIEDDTVRSDPTTLVNLAAHYTFGAVRFDVDLFNLFDARDADITYFYASRLPGEPTPVEDRHFHPVEPRQLRAGVRVLF